MPYWWENLQGKEKAGAVVGALIAALLLLYLLLQPLLSNRARLREEVGKRRAELTWMQNAAREISQAGFSSRNDAATPPLQLIDQMARENNLSDQLKRMEPGPGGEIKVWLNNAPYVDLLRWLRQLSGTGRLAISNLNVEKGASPGLVSAQLTLSSGSTP